MSNQVEVEVVPGGFAVNLPSGERVSITTGYAGSPGGFYVDFKGGDSFNTRLSRLLRGLAAPHPVVFVSPLVPLLEEQIDCTQHGKFTVEVKPAPGHEVKEVVESLHTEMMSDGTVAVSKRPLEFKEAEPAPTTGKKRGRPSKAETEAKKSETAAYSTGIKEQGFHPAESRALENVQLQPAAPTPVTIVTPEPAPAAPEPVSPFKEEMQDIDNRQQHAVVVPGGPPITFHPVEQPLDQIGRVVKLLTEPAMPPDIHPLDLKRSPSDKRMTDSALVRCAFQRYMTSEQEANANNPNYAPQLPPPGERIVDVSTDEGVVAFVHLLSAVKDRAAEMRVEIPQLEAFFALGDLGFCTQAAVLKVAARRPPVTR